MIENHQNNDATFVENRLWRKALAAKRFCNHEVKLPPAQLAYGDGFTMPL